MGEEPKSLPLTEFKNDLQNLFSKHSLNNPTLFKEISQCVEALMKEPHPKFEIGEECVPFPKIELESHEIEELKDVFDEDESFLRQLKAGKIKQRELEKKVSAERAVSIRRRYFESLLEIELTNIPSKDYNYELIKGACCENPIGYIPIPIGVAGPICIDDEEIYIPLATTEGALVASINRGCKVVSENGGVITHIKDVGMTRAPHFSFLDVREAGQFVEWIQISSTYQEIKKCFEATSSYAELKEIKPIQQDRDVALRFVAHTGDAMGMNMISKGCEKAVQYIQKNFKRAEFCSLSSNLCTDKKSASINWIEGRGKFATCEATIKSETVKKQLHTTVDKLVKLCQQKCSDGSSMAVTIGGGNAQAANIVAAMFIATGQDAAQVVSSSMCNTNMAKTDKGDLYVACTMKCLEVGTVGGGTILAPQKAALTMLNCSGPNLLKPGQNACRLAKIICSTVLAGEVSLMAALCTDDLVKSHMRMNRSALNVHAFTEPNLLKLNSKKSGADAELFKSASDLPKVENSLKLGNMGSKNGSQTSSEMSQISTAGASKSSQQMPRTNFFNNSAAVVESSPCFQQMKTTNCNNIL